MSENPYDAPAEDGASLNQYSAESSAGSEREVSTKAPAICLLIISIISISVTLFGLVGFSIATSSLLGLDDELVNEVLIDEQDNVRMFLELVGAFFAIVANFVILIGSINMLQLKNYRFAMLGSIIACSPCCSPCCLLSIPFGIWSLKVLNNEEVRLKFVANENGRNASEETPLIDQDE